MINCLRGQPGEREDCATKSFVRALCWIGLVSSVFLIGLGVWCHFNLDAIIRIPFVFISGGGGLVIGLYNLGYLLKQ